MNYYNPPSLQELIGWNWSNFEPYYQDLAERFLSEDTIQQWLTDWSFISRINNELFNRLYVPTTLNTADETLQKMFNAYMDDLFPKVKAAEQKLKAKLLESGVIPHEFDLPLRKMKVEAEIYRQDNLPLLSELEKLGNEYDKVISLQAVEWDGKEYTVSQMKTLYQDINRSLREKAWRLIAQRQLADRQPLNELWQKILKVRFQVAANAGFIDPKTAMADFRAYRWKQELRFDYTPQDCVKFHEAIEKVVVPAASRVLERRRKRLHLSTLRPWDLEVDPLGRTPLRPYSTEADLREKTSGIFHRVHPDLGGYFDLMQRENLLDLDNRKNKAPGAYCTEYLISHRPFVFCNSVGINDDVFTLFHESGHAFHVFETAHLPYYQQLSVPMEFAEVASMSMELLASPYLSADKGGFYSTADAARAQVEHLEANMIFWPYMAVVDAFQHWAHENPDQALQPDHCDDCWTALWKRFKPGVDWSGFEDVVATGWQRKLHIFKNPFYYIEYGLAQLGAALVWRNSLTNHAAAVSSYRKALSLGGTTSLPDLFKTAGARLAFDAATLQEAVNLMEETIEALDGIHDNGSSVN
jgi:oligoendopeptidase F